MQMMEVHPDLFRCSQCGRELSQSDGNISCSVCEKCYPCSYGMPDFSHDSEFYWGELERETMQRILASDTPVEEQLLGLLATEHEELQEYLTHYAMSRLRAGWKFAAALPRCGRVLDFGCGWGSLALSLGESVDEIVVSDVVPERVAVVCRRAAEKGLSSFVGCVSSGWPRLPFPDSHFDLVVLNGVLEWMPSAIAGNPQRIQQEFLKEIRRVLKPTGQLYIGIENRFGALYFLGKREEHTKLRFVSLLPRFLAAAYHRIAMGTKFRTYTYGYRALGRMLRMAGYAETTFYSPYPDYREFSKLVDLNNSSWIASAFRPTSFRGRLAFAVCKLTGVLKSVTPSFGVVASVEAGTDSWLQRLISNLKQTSALPVDAEVVGYDVSATAMVHVFLQSTEDQRLLALPLDGRAAGRLRLDVENRQIVRERLLEHRLLGTISGVHTGDWESVPFKVEVACKGERASQLEGSQELDNLCLGWLGEYHRTVIGPRSPFTLPPLTKRHLEGFLKSLGPGVGEEYEGFLRGVIEGCVKQVSTHGDFHKGNIFVFNGAIERVVDWDCGLKGGLPLWDVLDFFCTDLFNDECPWHEAFRRVVARVLVSDDAPLRNYCGSLALDDADLSTSMLTYPLLQYSVKMEFGDQRAEDLTRGLASVLRCATEGFSL